MNTIRQNTPDLWIKNIPQPAEDGHKYDRGHCIVIGGNLMTGAARLAAEGAARAGAGLVTVLAPEGTGTIYRSSLPAHIITESMVEDRCSQLQDPRRNALVLGPGFGPDASDVLSWLSSRADQALVLDADGINALGERPEGFKLLRRGDVLTPHEGEFSKAFPDITGSREERAKAAAQKIKGIIVLKGADTVISDGERVIVNDHASPYLASAGTGDVLAGMIGGFLAQGMPAFDAACAAVWIHGECGRIAGPGMVASDLPDHVPGVLSSALFSI